MMLITKRGKLSSQLLKGVVFFIQVFLHLQLFSMAFLQLRLCQVVLLLHFLEFLFKTLPLCFLFLQICYRWASGLIFALSLQSISQIRVITDQSLYQYQELFIMIVHLHVGFDCVFCYLTLDELADGVLLIFLKLLFRCHGKNFGHFKVL